MTKKHIATSMIVLWNIGQLEYVRDVVGIIAWSKSISS
jgi:hypothetical protein